MATEIATSYDITNLEIFKQNVIDTAVKTPRSSFKPILKFAKHGQWVLGSDKDEVTLDTKLAVWSPSLMEGWIGWQNGKVVNEHMRPISGSNIDLIEREPLEELSESDGWFKQVAFEGRFTAADTIEVIYKASSGGGRDAFYELVRKIGMQFNKDSDYINPVISLSRESYTHKQFGVIYKPQFVVQDWMSVSSTALYSGVVNADPPEPSTAIDPQNLL